MNFIRITLSLLFVTSTLLANAQIKWMSWEEATAAQEREPKKMLIDVYTDWCGWCKQMDKVTFSDPDVARLVSEDFYAVKLNAEQAGSLAYNGKTYSLDDSGRRPVHGLARELLSGRLGYPSVVFLDAKSKVIQSIPGFHNATDFRKIVQYFGDDIYLSKPWNEFAGR